LESAKKEKRGIFAAKDGGPIKLEKGACQQKAAQKTKSHEKERVHKGRNLETKRPGGAGGTKKKASGSPGCPGR